MKEQQVLLGFRLAVVLLLMLAFALIGQVAIIASAVAEALS